MNSSRIVGGFIVYVNEKHSLRSEFININVLSEILEQREDR